MARHPRQSENRFDSREDFDRLCRKLGFANAEKHLGRVLETAKRLGFRVVAMDTIIVDRACDRDPAMFKFVSGYLKTHPSEKAILFAGDDHVGYQTLVRDRDSLGKLLKAEFGGAVVSYSILCEPDNVLMKHLQDATEGAGLPAESAFPAAGSPIEHVPRQWVNTGQVRPLVLPYADWDFIVTQPKP